MSGENYANRYAVDERAGGRVSGRPVRRLGFCLLVDELIGKQEVVIKTLGELFVSVAGVAGGAILGDGRVGLILDLDRLFKEKSSDASR